MSTAPTLYLPEERPGTEWFRDIDGLWATSKHKDTNISYTVDWSSVLASGETISSVAYDANGVTVASSSNTSTTTTAIVTDTDGSLEVKVTTSNSRILIGMARSDVIGALIAGLSAEDPTPTERDIALRVRAKVYRMRSGGYSAADCARHARRLVDAEIERVEGVESGAN